MNEFQRCVNRKKLVKIKIDREWIRKELLASEYDLKRAKGSFKDKDHKWAIIQTYYTMFHAAKALVLQAGYREKSHGCLVIALDWLYVKKGSLQKDHLDHMEDAMDLRHQADYGLSYSKEDAEEAIERAADFIKAVKEILM